MACKSFRLADGTRGIICHTSYSQRFEDAEERRKRGERQAYCFECDKWVWPGQCSHTGTKYYTMKALRKAVKQMEREVAHLYPSQEKQYRKAVRKTIVDKL